MEATPFSLALNSAAAVRPKGPIDSPTSAPRESEPPLMKVWSAASLWITMIISVDCSPKVAPTPSPNVPTAQGALQLPSDFFLTTSPVPTEPVTIMPPCTVVMRPKAIAPLRPRLRFATAGNVVLSGTKGGLCCYTRVHFAPGYRAVYNRHGSPAIVIIGHLRPRAPFEDHPSDYEAPKPLCGSPHRAQTESADLGTGEIPQSPVHL